MKKMKRTVLASALLAALQAHAQTEAPEAPATPNAAAAKGADAQQQLPTTKAVVSGQALDQASQDGYAEAVRGVAGVSPANSKGSANDSINIRGIKLNLFSNYRLNGGLPIAGVSTVPTEDKARVETLKGANALMYGVASPAGIINMVTKRAGAHDVTSAMVAGNSFGQVGASADLGRRFGGDKQFGLRVNASDTHLQNGVVGGNGKFASIGADFQVTERLSLQGDYEYYTKNVAQQAGISLLPAVNGKVPITPVPDPRKLLSGPWARLNAHTSNKQIRADYVVSDSLSLMAEVGRSNSDRDNFTTRIGGYNIVTGAGGTVTVNTATQEYENTFSRIEARGRFGTWGLAHDLTGGVSRTERDANSLAQNQTVLTQKQNIFDPIELAAPVFTKAPTSQLQISKDSAVYAYDTIGIGPQWKLLLGLRSTKDEEISAARSKTTNVTSPAYGVLFDAMPGVTLFGSVMSGLEAGGTAPATAVNVNEILPSAVSKQRELGIRVTRFKGINFSSSYFEITRANAVTDPVTKIFANNGDIQYKGLEATLTWQMDRQWGLTTGGQLLHAKQVSPDPTFNGFTPENTPKAVGNVGLSYRTDWLKGLTLNGGISGISKRFVNNQEQATIPGYSLISAGASYATRIAGRRVGLQLSVDNLRNKSYWNSVQTGTYGTGMDRSVKLSLRVDDI
ncbi:TonB-dependent siderophore receptor [Pelomonas sp. KK5]|uniref:TonB-dependent siderophore receptor n=1 Tax=Pelomonas sp. KK5 TaxID=1855730 RepID=UPI00097BF3E5|nr:TonB-dependent siderophore receptor [Pelomonas sp. KK5]